MRKRLLAIIATAAMVVAMVPVMAFAAPVTVTTESALSTAIATGGDVQLGADIEITTSIKVNKDVNLDLNGYTLTAPHNYNGGSNLYAFIIETGTFTLDDNSTAQTGKISCKYSGIETKGGTFIMNGGKIIAADLSMAVAVVNYGGTVIINEGEIEAYDTAITNMAYFTNSATTEIKGGKISLLESNNNYALFEVGGKYNNGSGNFSVSGGEMSSNDSPIFAYDDKTGSVEAKVSGGQFPVDADIDEYLAANFEVDANGKVVEKAPAAGGQGTTTPEKSPNTGDNSMAPIAVAGLALAVMAAVAATRRRTN